MKKRDPWKMALLGTGAVIVLACGGGAAVNTNSGSSGVTSKGSSDAKADVALTTCAMASNTFEGPEAALKITNNSSKPSNYIIEVAFVSKDGATQYDTGTAAVNGLAPGQSANEKATSLKSEARTAAAAGFSCKVLNVTRYAA